MSYPQKKKRHRKEQKSERHQAKIKPQKSFLRTTAVCVLYSRFDARTGIACVGLANWRAKLHF